MGLEKRIERTKTLFDPKHWELFTEFAKFEMMSGGPDPHVAFVGGHSAFEDYAERLWRGFVYISAYNVASAEIMWKAYPWPRVMDEDIELWLEENWKGITTRTERKSVRIISNMARFFRDSGAWVQDVLDGNKQYIDDPNLGPKERYNIMYDDVIDSVTYLGRYVAIKLLEYFKRYLEMDIELPDVRPLGGWSPRMTLSLLFPHMIENFLGSDSEENLNLLDEYSCEALSRLWEVGLIQADHFTLEVALCNYRQSYVGSKLYPGRTHDTEKRYLNKILPHWQKTDPSMLEDIQFYNVRKAIFPPEHLSELAPTTWEVRSSEIGVIAKEGMIWSDLLYDYNMTKLGGNFHNPSVQPDRIDRLYRAWVMREHALTLAGMQKLLLGKVDTTLPKTQATMNEVVAGELYQRGKFMDDPLPKKLALLKKYGVNVVFNWWHTHDSEIMPFLDHYEHHYFPDSEKELPEEWLMEMSVKIADMIDDGDTVLSHCFGGNNRSGIINALVVRELYDGITGVEAMEMVRENKMRALHNESYAKYLAGLPAIER